MTDRRAASLRLRERDDVERGVHELPSLHFLFCT
jgi:hypothetical protein